MPGWRPASRSRAAAMVAPLRQTSSTSSSAPSGAAAPGAMSSSRSRTGRPVCRPTSAAGSRPLSGIAATAEKSPGSRQRLWLTSRASSATVLKSLTATIDRRLPCRYRPPPPLMRSRRRGKGPGDGGGGAAPGNYARARGFIRRPPRCMGRPGQGPRQARAARPTRGFGESGDDASPEGIAADAGAEPRRPASGWRWRSSRRCRSSGTGSPGSPAPGRGRSSATGR